jgi:hypothetical protein
MGLVYYVVMCFVVYFSAGTAFHIEKSAFEVKNVY